MDLTPVHNDSGYLSSSATSASSAKRVLCFPTESTPSTSLIGTRKRRSETFVHKTRKLSDILETNVELSPIHSSTKTSFILEQTEDSCFTHSLSDSEKLTSSLEKCSLDFSQSPKKSKYEEIPKRKSSSAPGTPQREEENSFRKFYSLDLTPPKSNVKIGTPERLGILYPTLKEVKSPAMVRLDLKRTKKPAKKRLFHRDFVYIFTEMYEVEHIIFKIFSYLSNTDLVNVAKVSKLWKKSLENHVPSYRRYKTHLRNITIRKENTYLPQTQTKAIRFRKDPCSPSRVNWAKFSRVGACLSGAQRLTKCMSCAAPAVVERSLARCSAKSCGFLWCTRCGRGDRSPTRVPCQCSTPHSPPLQNISNTDVAAPSPDDLYYLDKAASVDKNCNSYKPHALTNCNEVCRRGEALPRGGFDVQQHREEIRRAKRTLSRRTPAPPGSPPRNAYAAGSKQSKRNLRRL